MGCKHDYRVNYAGGDLVCTKCGRHHSGVNARRGGRGTGIAIGVVSCMVIAGIAAFVTYGLPGIGDNVEMASERVTTALEAAEPLAETVPELVDDAAAVVDDVAAIVAETVPDMVADHLPDIDGHKLLNIPSTQSPAAFAALVEEGVFQLTNAERAAVGIDPLSRSPVIDGIARDHSRDMYNFAYFSHDNLLGQDPTDRGLAAGYDCTKDYGSYYTTGLAENIWMVEGLRYNADIYETAATIVDDWMGSPGHRANILDPSYDRIGIGVFVSPGRTLHATQNFC